ncbi:MAG: hypothetical protein HY791_34335 [Deltaproteobacteria bacterium]|nr:hypothetical protein [Deltaproteobacteria bacterium]
MKRVGIVGASTDVHTAYLAAGISRIGAEPVVVHTDLVPRHHRLTIDDHEVRYEGVSLSELRVLFLRRIQQTLPIFDPDSMSLSGLPTWPERYVAERERQSLLASAFQVLERERLVVNSTSAINLHFLKMDQLRILAQRGVRVPRSLATSDPDEVVSFVEREGEVIYKPLAGGALVRSLRPVDLTPSKLATLRHAPSLFQERIPGDEHRAYVLDGEPLAAFEIPCEGVVDAREALDRARPAELSERSWDECVRASRALGMIFGAIDLRHSADGAPVVLEVNPTPAISFYDDPETGAVISRLAAYLVAHA